MRLTFIIILFFGHISCNNLADKKSTYEESENDSLVQDEEKVAFEKKLQTDNSEKGLPLNRTYTGTSTKLYNCTFRINKDRTINFIYDRDNNGIYGEHLGTIKKINDTLFHVKANMTIGQFYMKSYHLDTLYISIDSTIARELDKISIEFSNKTQKHFAGYDKKGEPISLLKIPIDKRIFNNRKGTNTIKLIINRKNILSDNFLTFEIPFGSAASFTKGDKEDFYVVINNEQLNTIKSAPLQTGNFKLKRK